MVELGKGISILTLSASMVLGNPTGVNKTLDDTKIAAAMLTEDKRLNSSRIELGEETKSVLVELKVECGENGCITLNGDGSINYGYTLNPRLANNGKKFDLDGKTVFGNIDGVDVKAILDKNSENGRSKYTRIEIGKQLDISGITYKILFTNGIDVDYDVFVEFLEALREGELTLDYLKEMYDINEFTIKQLLTNPHTKKHFEVKKYTEVKNILGDIENENRTQEELGKRIRGSEKVLNTLDKMGKKLGN